VKKRGRPPNPPDESPDWIPYNSVLQDAITQFGAEELAIEKLNDAFAAGKIHCKFERLGDKPKRLKRSDRIEVLIVPDEIREGWDARLEVRLNGEKQTDWLFLWNFDRIKYFRTPAESAQAKMGKTKETLVAEGHPLRYDWIEIVLFADRLRTRLRRIHRVRDVLYL